MSKGKKKETVSKFYDSLCTTYFEKYKQKEKWKHVILEGELTKYIISNYGRIRNIEKMSIPTIMLVNEHYYVVLKLDSGEVRKIGIYRLVALMFIPVPQEYIDAGYSIDKLVVDHKRDGDYDNFDDNTVWNLQWLTQRENISKARKGGYKPFYHVNFRDELDKMILDGCGNDEIYKVITEKYGYTKEDIKAQLQVRRRRLGKTLKIHYERPKEFTEKVDELLKQGLSNDEIIEKLNMPREGRSSARLLQYRRSLLKIPANTSKYLTNEENEKLKELFEKNLSINDIIKYFNLNLNDEELIKFKQTLYARKYLYFKNKK